jgi:oxygen-independent coproporphyrinogen-3 oxidase
VERAAIAERLAAAEQQGWIRRNGDRIVPTEFGRRFTNDVISLFLDD